MVELLRALWRKNPDMRLGQLVANVFSHWEMTTLFHVEDDAMAERLRAILEGGWS